ncbi:hypothetical protein Pelo_1738 [Pelomyxa schiedti]|nr:hypothetical protein Pelo_1738 [Pelomyxa schiedti]
MSGHLPRSCRVSNLALLRLEAEPLDPREARLPSPESALELDVDDDAVVADADADAEALMGLAVPTGLMRRVWWWCLCSCDAEDAVGSGGVSAGDDEAAEGDGATTAAGPRTTATPPCDLRLLPSRNDIFPILSRRSRPGYCLAECAQVHGRVDLLGALVVGDGAAAVHDDGCPGRHPEVLDQQPVASDHAALEVVGAQLDVAYLVLLLVPLLRKWQIRAALCESDTIMQRELCPWATPLPCCQAPQSGSCKRQYPKTAPRRSHSTSPQQAESQVTTQDQPNHPRSAHALLMRYLGLPPHSPSCH